MADRTGNVEQRFRVFADQIDAVEVARLHVHNTRLRLAAQESDLADARRDLERMRASLLPYLTTEFGELLEIGGDKP